MPCQTVVMFGDSEELNAITYRQMSGRAGRRGFDKRGNVVFAAIPQHKVRHLLRTHV
jgi:superfamily II RNA helicase